MNLGSGAEPRIVFIIPYFGKWPFWMPFFLESCRKNPSIDWVFFTDCGVPAPAPANTRFIEMSYEDYCALVSRRLVIDFHPPSAYKLCDIKPALGFVHADLLDGYDFWAFGDLDVIYGDLRAYFTAERLAGKDLFSTHHRRISGHLCLIRNTPEMLEAFKQIPRWQDRYADPQHYALDEGAFSRLFVRHKNWPEKLRVFARRFYRWGRLSEFVEAHSTYTLLNDGSRLFPRQWRWDQGVLTNDHFGAARPLPYLHFMVWKNTIWKERSAEQLVVDPALAYKPAWIISEDGWREPEREYGA